MNWKLFFIGVGFIIVGYLMYRGIKGEKPASEKNNYKGLFPSNYISYWIWLVMSVVVGVVFIIESLPANI